MLPFKVLCPFVIQAGRLSTPPLPLPLPTLAEGAVKAAPLAGGLVSSYFDVFDSCFGCHLSVPPTFGAEVP